MDVDLHAIKYQILWLENCEPHSQEGKIRNLNPNYTVPSNDLNTDYAFPWMNNAIEIFRKQEKIRQESGIGERTTDPAQLLSNYQGYAERWKLLDKTWSLTANNRPDLAKQQLSQYKLSDGARPARLSDALFHFGSLLLGPWYDLLFVNVIEVIRLVREQHPHLFKDFFEYYSTELYDKNILNTRHLFEDYFRDFSDFNQTLLMVQYGSEVSDKVTATSSSFARTKMFYGNAFEVLSEHFVLPSCLNNMQRGRPFDKFETMNLKKYLEIKKANRANPFKTNEAFAPLVTEFESQLRNGSHHASISIDRAGHEITYRSAGTGAKHRISYAQYTSKCNRLLLSEVGLFCVDLVFGSTLRPNF